MNPYTANIKLSTVKSFIIFFITVITYLSNVKRKHKIVV